MKLFQDSKFQTTATEHPSEHFFKKLNKNWVDNEQYPYMQWLDFSGEIKIFTGYWAFNTYLHI